MPLSIGAGGNIEQHIESDTYNPRTWDMANSKLLNIQLLDSRAFRLVTNLEPPTTPVTAQTYKDMGLPFYRLGRDNERSVDGIAGSWSGGIKGAMETASANMKQLAERETITLVGGPSTQQNWGLLRSGAWGPLDLEDRMDEGDDEEQEDPLADDSFDGEEHMEFPVVLLDVDETVPGFKSILEDESDEGY